MTDSSKCPAFPAGIHHIAEVMPAVLAAHGLPCEHDPDAAPPDRNAENDLFDIMLAGLESALVSGVPEHILGCSQRPFPPPNR